MKSIEKYIISTFVAMVTLLCAVSCEDYLDKAPEADITDKVVFGNFNSFQGFVEQMYNCIQDPDKGEYWANYSFADENLNAYPYPFDLGNYWDPSRYFYGRPVNVTNGEPTDRRVWEFAWYAIRVANQTLAKIDEEGLFQGTEEEKNLIKGQALFFRGWFYFEICRYWGGMPYINRVLDPTENLTTEEFKRLNFQETAKLMAQDFRAAADLLPDHWDKSGPGQTTLGHNQDRINKFHALGYLGKSLLYAASPMMNEEATGNNAYNPELAAQAAKAFGELLALADQTGIYKLQTWDTYTDIFWRLNWQRSGGTEVIMNPIIYNPGRVRWSAIIPRVPVSFGIGGGADADVVTHNIVQNFGMANGLPINDPASGYNPDDPWTGRDPRFYKTVVKDGDRIHRDKPGDMYAELYNGGRHKSQISAPSATGYYCKKFAPMGADFTTSLADALQAYVPYLRLADIYLMYAEAVLFSPGGSPSATSGNYNLTAAQALNMIRNRAQLPDLDPKYTASNNLFFEEIVRERAVELMMEGARFCDLRRWNRNGDPRYLDKTAIDFDRGPDGKPININERVVIRRTVEKKHNWLPIQVKFTKQYEGFPQNPGW